MPDPGPRGVLHRLADVTPERVAWLWPGHLPAGKLVVLDGDPSLGKSTLALTFAAHVSTGRPWPDGADCPAGDAVILSAEDGLADTLRPRLDAAGGDAARVHALTAVRTVSDDGHGGREITTRPPTLADHAVIGEEIERTRARLLVIDVLMAYMPSTVDSHRDQDVRGVLHRLAALAEQTGCCVLLLRHLNKTSAGNALYRGGGSIGIVGAARAGFLVAPDPDDAERRVLACTKNNLAPLPPSRSYRLSTVPGADVARVEWVGASDHAAADLLTTGSEEDRTERDEAAEWLLSYLTDQGGAAPAADVVKAAARDGIAKTTLHRARKRAGVTTSKGSTLRSGWTWRHPADTSPKVPEGSGDSSSRDLESPEPSGNLRAVPTPQEGDAP